MRHWKLWIACVISVSIIVIFQNCAGDFNSSEYAGASGAPPEVDTVIPALVQAPQNTSVQLGQSVAFTITATGTNLKYQWAKNGQDLAGATDYIFSLAAAAAADAGTYSVTVSNTLGTIASTAQLTVISPPPVGTAPKIITPVRDTFAFAGRNATLIVTASGDNLTYQWYYTSNLAGAIETLLVGKTTNSIAFLPTRVSNSGTYRVEIKNGFGAVSSSGILEVEVLNFL